MAQETRVGGRRESLLFHTSSTVRLNEMTSAPHMEDEVLLALLCVRERNNNNH